MDVKRFDDAAAQASTLIKALAHPARLRIVCALAGQDCCVTELAELAGAPVAATSQQLALLRKDGIVKARRARKSVLYSLCDARTKKFVATLADAFCGAGFKSKGKSP